MRRMSSENFHAKATFRLCKQIDTRKSWSAHEVCLWGWPSNGRGEAHRPTSKFKEGPCVQSSWTRHRCKRAWKRLGPYLTKRRVDGCRASARSALSRSGGRRYWMSYHGGVFHYPAAARKADGPAWGVEWADGAAWRCTSTCWPSSTTRLQCGDEDVACWAMASVLHKTESKSGPSVDLRMLLVGVRVDMPTQNNQTLCEFKTQSVQYEGPTSACRGTSTKDVTACWLWLWLLVTLSPLRRTRRTSVLNLSNY
jgi:hypothetical protein